MKKKTKRKGMKMSEEQILNEVKRSASSLKMGEDEALLKYEEICVENGVEQTEQETC